MGNWTFFVICLAIIGFKYVQGQLISASPKEPLTTCESNWFEFQAQCYLYSKSIDQSNNNIHNLDSTTTSQTDNTESIQEAGEGLSKAQQTYPGTFSSQVQGLKDYQEAEYDCRQKESHLVSISSKEVEEFIFTLTGPDDEIWINSSTEYQIEYTKWKYQEHHNQSQENLSSNAATYDPKTSCAFASSSKRKLFISDSCGDFRSYICQKQRDRDLPQERGSLCPNCKSRQKRTYEVPKIDLTKETQNQQLFSKNMPSIYFLPKDKLHPAPQVTPKDPHGSFFYHRQPATHDRIPPFQSRFSYGFRHLHADQKEHFKEIFDSGMRTIKPPVTLGHHTKHRLDFHRPMQIGSPLAIRLHLSERAKEDAVKSIFQAPSAILSEANANLSVEAITASITDTNTAIPLRTDAKMPTLPTVSGIGYHTEPSSKVSPASRCHQDEALYHESCYTKPTTDNAVDFDSALLNCVQRGGLPVVIKSYEEQLFISELMQSIQTPVWIGVTRDANETSELKLIWADGTPVHKSDYRYVAPGSPNKHCMTVTNNLTENATWHLQNCSQPFPYICQSEAAPAPAPAAEDIPFSGEECNDGWELVGERCYKVFPKPASWNDSERHCTNYGAHLASADSVEEEDVLRRLTQSSDVSEFFLSFWVGLEITSKDEFRWTDETPIGYLNWAEGQPDFHREKEHCGSATRISFRIHDSPCSAFLPFICEAIKGKMLVTEELQQKKPHSRCEDDPSWLLYNDHCYKIISSEEEQSPKSWADSRRLCRDIGGELASIHSIKENYWLQSKVLHLKENVLWIGGQSYMDSGYEWADGTPNDFTNWAKGEPNNNFDQEDCIAFYTHNFGYWNDQNCGHLQGRICKRPLGSTHPPPVTTQVPEGNCPKGWIHAGTKCLKFVKEMVSFDDARKGCKILDPQADLASVASAKEQAYITAALGELKASMWLGLRYEQGFLWMDQSVLTYTNWAQGEPSSGGWMDEHHEENCVHTHIYNLAGQWNNINCNGLFGYICQRSPDPSMEESDPFPACAVPFDKYLNYSGKCFRPERSSKTWEEAENACIKEGGHLVSSSNRAESAWLWVLAQHFSLEDPWIGYNNRRDTNIFEWSDTWPALYTKWGKGEPNISTVNHNCATVRSDDGLWYLQNCEEERPFICKYTEETLPTPDTPKGGICPNGQWLDLGGSFCYLLVTDASPWTDANKHCAYEGSDLASIHNKAELDLIVQAAHNIQDPMWIGLVQMKDGFGWSDGTGYDFINWMDGEPNSGGEECTEIYPGTGLWNNNFCSNARPFICKVLKECDDCDYSDLGVPAEQTGGSPNTGAIVGMVIPLSILVLGGLSYLVYYYARKPSPLGERGTFGFDNAVYSGEGMSQMNSGASFQLQETTDDADDEGEDDDDEDT